MENKENILKVALDLFSAKGYDGVGIQEIVEKAGITKPTLYHYFGSKRGLLESLIEQYFSRFFDVVKTAAIYKGDLPLTMTNITRAIFGFVSENRDFYRMYLSMCFSSPDSEPYAAIHKYNINLYLVLEDLFKKASKDHGNMRDRQKRYAFTFLGMINNYVTLYLGNYIELNDEAIFLAVHQFSHGIYS